MGFISSEKTNNEQSLPTSLSELNSNSHISFVMDYLNFQNRAIAAISLIGVMPNLEVEVKGKNPLARALEKMQPWKINRFPFRLPLVEKKVFELSCKALQDKVTKENFETMESLTWNLLVHETAAILEASQSPEYTQHIPQSLRINALQMLGIQKEMIRIHAKHTNGDLYRYDALGETLSFDTSAYLREVQLELDENYQNYLAQLERITQIPIETLVPFAQFSGLPPRAYEGRQARMAGGEDGDTFLQYKQKYESALTLATMRKHKQIHEIFLNFSEILSTYQNFAVQIGTLSSRSLRVLEQRGVFIESLHTVEDVIQAQEKIRSTIQRISWSDAKGFVLAWKELLRSLSLRKENKDDDVERFTYEPVPMNLTEEKIEEARKAVRSFIIRRLIDRKKKKEVSVFQPYMLSFVLAAWPYFLLGQPIQESVYAAKRAVPLVQSIADSPETLLLEAKKLIESIQQPAGIVFGPKLVDRAFEAIGVEDVFDYDPRIGMFDPKNTGKTFEEEKRKRNQKNGPIQYPAAFNENLSERLQFFPLAEYQYRYQENKPFSIEFITPTFELKQKKRENEEDPRDREWKSISMKEFLESKIPEEYPDVYGKVQLHNDDLKKRKLIVVPSFWIDADAVVMHENERHAVSVGVQQSSNMNSQLVIEVDQGQRITVMFIKHVAGTKEDQKGIIPLSQATANYEVLMHQKIDSQTINFIQTWGLDFDKIEKRAQELQKSGEKLPWGWVDHSTEYEREKYFALEAIREEFIKLGVKYSRDVAPNPYLTTKDVRTYFIAANTTGLDCDGLSLIGVLALDAYEASRNKDSTTQYTKFINIGETDTDQDGIFYGNKPDHAQAGFGWGNYRMGLEMTEGVPVSKKISPEEWLSFSSKMESIIGIQVAQNIDDKILLYFSLAMGSLLTAYVGARSYRVQREKFAEDEVIEGKIRHALLGSKELFGLLSPEQYSELPILLTYLTTDIYRGRRNDHVSQVEEFEHILLEKKMWQAGEVERPINEMLKEIGSYVFRDLFIESQNRRIKDAKKALQLVMKKIGKQDERYRLYYLIYGLLKLRPLVAFSENNNQNQVSNKQE